MARAGDLLVIAEVRTRASDAFGGAAASISRAQTTAHRRHRRLLLQRHPELRRCRVRFDVHRGARRHVEWLKHAFDA